MINYRALFDDLVNEPDGQTAAPPFIRETR